MIGYYVHHQGHGHLHRALAFAAAWSARWDEPVTALSSVPRPRSWTGPWVDLARDDAAETASDPTARGRLHWVPLGDAGLRSRAAAMSRWIAEHQPRAVVVDVSVEAVLLVRLHGVPVVTVLQPGRRTDAAHLTGLRTADAVVCPWPAAAEDAVRRMSPGLPRDVDERAVRIGAVSRFRALDGRPPDRTGARPSPRVTVLEGTGGPGLLSAAAHRILGRPGDGPATSGWSWQALASGVSWHDDPVPVLASSEVVVTHAGGGSLADVAAARVPAVAVPGARPFDEQRVAASVLARGPWPVVVRDSVEEALSPETLAEASRLDGRCWEGWIDGAADRFVDVVASVALPASLPVALPVTRNGAPT
jgi:hypothetical protein